MSAGSGWAALRGRAAVLLAAAALLLGTSGMAAAPAVAEPVVVVAHTDEAASGSPRDVAPAVSLEASVIPANGGLVFAASGWEAGVPVTVHITGPAELLDETLPDADGTFVRRIEIMSSDSGGGVHPDAQFPVGEYTLTLSQESPATPDELEPEDDGTSTPSTPPVGGSEDPTGSATPSDEAEPRGGSGDAREVVTVQVTFTVEAAPQGSAVPSPSSTPDQELAATGAGEFAIIAGIAALVFVLGAVIVLIARARIRQR